MSDEAALLRAEFAALKDDCEERDRRWVAAYSELEVLANYWRIDNNELHFPLEHERPYPWGDFLASLPSAEVRPESGAARTDFLASEEDARVAEAPGAPRTDLSALTASIAEANSEVGTVSLDSVDKEETRVEEDLEWEPEQDAATAAAVSAAPRSRERNGRFKGRYGPSKYKGVYREGKKFKASVKCGGKDEHLGVFFTEVEAAKAHDARVRELGRGRRKFNFPIADDVAATAAAPAPLEDLESEDLDSEDLDSEDLDSEDLEWEPEHNAAAGAGSAAPRSREIRPLPPLSKYKGVYRQRGSYGAKIIVRGVQTYLGTFSSEVEAAKAYDAKKIQLGRLDGLNFPTAPPVKRAKTTASQ